MSPIIEAMKPSPNSDRQSCASLGELLPKNGTAFATESPTTFVSSRPTIFGSSRRAGIAGNLVQRPVRNGLHRQPRSRSLTSAAARAIVMHRVALDYGHLQSVVMSPWVGPIPPAVKI